MSNFFLWPWNHNGSKASTSLPRYADPDELYIRPPRPKSSRTFTSTQSFTSTSSSTSSPLPHPQSLLPPPPPDTHPNNTSLDSHISITHDTNWDVLVESTPQQVATSEAHDLMLRLVHHDESKYVNRLMNIMSTFRDNFGALTAEYQPFKLIEKTNISHNTIQFRFALPSSTMRLGLPVGKHMLLKFTGADDKPISRPYTPVTSDHQLGYFDLMIKIYDKGLMSQHLKALPLGGTIDIRGPLGSLTYHGQGAFTIKRKTGEQKIRASQIGMLAGGTGITPMLQIIREICRTTSDDTLTSLLFANVTSDDILCKKELDECADQHKNIKVAYTLDKPTDSWTGFRGFITPVMIQQVLPPPANDTLILICGPKPMTDMMCKHLESLDYKPEQYFVY